MLTAKKDNKVYDIPKQDKQRYLDEGFDVYEDGELVQYSPKKKIEYNKYVELEKKMKAVVAENEKGNAPILELQKVHDALLKEHEALVKEHEALAKERDALAADIKKLEKPKS